MVTFEDIWPLLYEHGASAKKREGTLRFWQTLTEEQQELVFTTISRKLAENKYVQYDPIRAITENMRHVPGSIKEPVFLRGDEGGNLVQVRYNGAYKICTRQTAEEFKLEIIRNWN